MSFFKLTEKVIPTHVINSGKQRFVLSIGHSFSPAKNWYSKSQVELLPGNSLSSFQVSQVAYDLQREIDFHQTLSPEVTEKLRVELLQTIQEDATQMRVFWEELKRRVVSGPRDLPVQYAANYVYLAGRLGEFDAKSFEANLLPLIREKWEYLSLQNVCDLVDGLTRVGYYENTKLWEDLNVLANQKLQKGLPERVKNSNSFVFQYEPAAEEKPCDCNLFKLAMKAKPFEVAAYRVLEALDPLYYSVYSRFTIHEKKATRTFVSPIPSVEVKGLVKNLDLAKEKTKISGVEEGIRKELSRF